MIKRILIAALLLMLLAGTFVFVYPIVRQRMRNCDDFTAPVIAAETQGTIALSCWPRVTFLEQEYFGFCTKVHRSRLGPYLREDLNGPEVPKLGVVQAVKRIIGVPTHEGIVIEAENPHQCKHGSEFVMFADSLSDSRYDELTREIKRPL